MEILFHRMLWALLFLVLVLAYRKQWLWIPELLKKPKLIAGFACSALLLSTNWLIYIWAVNNNHVIDASLGYFITPLVSVLLGYVFLHERMRPVQWCAVGLAASGVIWLGLRKLQFFKRCWEFLLIQDKLTSVASIAFNFSLVHGERITGYFCTVNQQIEIVIPAKVARRFEIASAQYLVLSLF